MTATARIPGRAAGRAPGRVPVVRVRRLAVVEPGTRRRMPGLIGVSAVLVLLVMLATAAVHIALISGQRQLDRLDAEINAERLTQESLRQSETQLRSPAEVRRIATEQLGMVPAQPPTLVSPGPTLIGVLPPALAPATDAPATSAEATPR